MTELYIGLAAILAGLIAVFVASIFVLAQISWRTYSLVTPSLLFRGWRVFALLGVALPSFVLSLGGAVRTAYPTFEAFTGNQHTGFLIENPWAASGIAAGALISGVLAAWIVIQRATDLRGPGIITTMAQDIDREKWKEWVGFLQAESVGDSGNVSARQAEGLADPLASLFEVANLAVLDRRFTLPSHVLREVHSFLVGLAQREDEEEPDPLVALSIDTVIPHVNDFIGTSASVGAESQVDLGIAHLTALAMLEEFEPNGGRAVRVSYELYLWASRFIEERQDASAVSAIRHISRIAEWAAKRDDWDTFSDVVLALGKVGEEVAVNLKDEAEKMLPAGYTEPRYDNPDSSLQQAMEQAVNLITNYQRGVKGVIHQSRLVLDALLVCCSSFLKSQPYGVRADHAAARFVSYMGYLGITGAKSEREDVAGMVAYEIEQLYQLPNATPAEAEQFMTSACIACFEMGIYVEANRALSKTAGEKVGTDLRDRLADICARSGSVALSEARIISLYQSGLPINIEDQAKIDFQARVTAASAVL